MRDPSAASRPWTSAVLFGVVLLSRVPFLGNGYGLDTDAWSLLDAGRSIASGSYAASRLPGYPLPELGLSFVWDKGPWIVNGVTALFSAVAAVLFRAILKAHACQHAFLGALALAFVPVVFVHSVDAMDYLWALVPLLAAWRSALAGRFALAGVLVGLAVGCRMTSALALAPLSVLCFDGAQRGAARRLIIMSSAAAAVGAMAYLAPFLVYGREFLSTYPGSVPLRVALRRLGPGVWGETGSWALALALVGVVVRALRSSAPHGSLRASACAAGILVFLAAFAAQPHDAGYLIPALPFVLALFAQLLSSRGFAGLAIALLPAPFVDIGLGGIAEGPLLRDRRERELLVRRIDTVFAELARLSETKVAVAAGPLRIPLFVEYSLRRPANTEYVFFGAMTLLQAKQAAELGYTLRSLSLGNLYYRKLVDAGAERIEIPAK